MKMIKSLTKAAACCMAIAAMLMFASCLPDGDGYNYTSQFARVATIDYSSDPISFHCDYTNEKFVFTNVTSADDLGPFDLKGAKRALLNIYMEANAKAANYELISGAPIHAEAVCGKLPADATLNPVYGFTRLELDTWSYPYAWVSRGYLSIVPQILSDADATPYLVPKAVSGDTLCFDLRMAYELGKKNYRSQYACFDLRTLADTAQADAAVKPVMKEMIDRVNMGDTVMARISAYYKTAYPDTVITATVPTSYFSLQIP